MKIFLLVAFLFPQLMGFEVPRPLPYIVVDTATHRAYGIFESYDDANDWGGKHFPHVVIYKLESPK